jgi:hypothetical protein
MVRYLLLVGVLGFTACAQADVDFKQARHLEEGGEFLRALSAYDDFIRDHKTDPRLGEVSLRAGKIFADAIGDCDKALPHFERAVRSAVQPWAERAKSAILDCPNFFPLTDGGSWTFVDSLSGGENMRMVLGVKTSSGGLAGRLTGEMYAGETKIMDVDSTIVKDGWTIYEHKGADIMPILKYPFLQGRNWQTQLQGQSVTYTIVGVNLSLKIKAGSFAGCVKVRQRTAKYPSWVFDYYCPGVGRVKKTVGVPGVENPNTELAAYQVPKA